MNPAVALMIGGVLAVAGASILWFSNRRRKSWGDFLFAENKHGLYCIPKAAAHRPAALAALRGDVWERRTLEFMLEHGKGGIIVTAGAFFGDALPALSKVCRKVYACEPNPENYRCAEITRLINRCDNVHLYQKGLGEKEETKQLVVADHEGRSLGGGSQIADISSRGRQSTSIMLTTIDAIVQGEDVTLIHLDVEGYEEYALHGAAETLKRCRPLLILETVPKGLAGYGEPERIEEGTFLLRPT